MAPAASGGGHLMDIETLIEAEMVMERLEALHETV